MAMEISSVRHTAVPMQSQTNAFPNQFVTPNVQNNGATQVSQGKNTEINKSALPEGRFVRRSDVRLFSSCRTGNLLTWMTWLLHNVLLVTYAYAENLLVPLRTKLTTTRRTFAYSAPHIWNSRYFVSLGLVGPYLSSFRHMLKTHLYPYHPQ